MKSNDIGGKIVQPLSRESNMTKIVQQPSFRGMYIGTVRGFPKFGGISEPVGHEGIRRNGSPCKEQLFKFKINNHE